MENQEYRTILQQQKNFFASGATRPLCFRQKQLQHIKQLLHSYEHDILKALHADLAKPTFEAYTSELYLCHQELDYALRNLCCWSKPQQHKTPWLIKPASFYVTAEPYGVALIMAPWNFPLQLIIIPLIGALAAGNCALLKPSEFAPETSSLLAQLINNNFPSYYLHIITGDNATGAALAQLPFDYIFFTGSSAVGKLVMQSAAHNLVPLTLELGGKNPCIVDRCTDLKAAAKKIMWAKCYNAGQSCLAPDYVLVHKNCKEQFTTYMAQAVYAMYGKNPEQSPDYGRIINQKHMERLKRLLKSGTIIVGGAVNNDTRYIAPTIIENVDWYSPIMQEEIFGPLLPILTFSTHKECIAYTQQTKPLAIYCFSTYDQFVQQLIRCTQSGAVIVNDAVIHAFNSDVPFGGIGSSGFGTYRGKKSFDTFSHYKTIVATPTAWNIPFRYPPYKRIAWLLQKIMRY